MRSTTLSILLLLALSLLLWGCGGGGSGGGEEDGGGQEERTQQQQGGEQTSGEEQAGGGERKIALGRVASVNEGAGRFSIEPSTEEQGEEPIVFKLAEGGVVLLDGEETELSGMEEGQQAQVEYVVIGELNRARKVELFGSEATGQ